MKVFIVSAWHNEAFLAPFFLNHYAWADRIHLIIGEDTTDATRAICSRYRNTWVEQFTFPDKLLNDTLKIKKFNEVVPQLDCDWAIALDADEFIFAPHDEDPREFLSRQTGNLLYAEMWQAWRHVSESNLDPSKPALGQRRHGTTQAHHIKPIIVRPETRIVWQPGHHGYLRNGRIHPSPHVFLGAHWGMADADMAIARYIDGRAKRMSEENLRKHHGFHTLGLTAESIRQLCTEHAHDPLLPWIEEKTA
jgi:hypothetical protein